MTTKLQKISEISKKLTNEEFNLFMKYLDTNKVTERDIQYLQKQRAGVSRNYTLTIKEKNWVTSEYSRELNRIGLILNDASLRKKLGKLGIMVFGPTGTGKTTLINQIGQLNRKYIFETLDLTGFVSSKMGQTQINFLTMANKYNSIKKNQIIFIDELDSIILNRESANDLGEHSRVISSFIKFLDLLEERIIVIAATNIISKIDQAVLRRFNLQIQSRLISVDEFLNLIQKYGNFKFTTYEINFLKLLLKKDSFTISEVESYRKHIIVEKKLNPKITNLEMFVDYFKVHFKYNDEEISIRKKKMLVKAGIIGHD